MSLAPGKQSMFRIHSGLRDCLVRVPIADCTVSHVVTLSHYEYQYYANRIILVYMHSKSYLLSGERGEANLSRGRAGNTMMGIRAGTAGYCYYQRSTQKY
jgi:hypothetical protein